MATKTQFKAVTLAEAKAHLRVLHNNEDALITGLCAAAADLDADYSLLELVGAGVTPDPTPPAVKQAMLLTIGFWYENREDMAMKSPSTRSAHNLLKAYRSRGAAITVEVV
jgi:hypothetical protein